MEGTINKRCCRPRPALGMASPGDILKLRKNTTRRGPATNGYPRDDYVSNHDARRNGCPEPPTGSRGSEGDALSPQEGRGRLHVISSIRIRGRKGDPRAVTQSRRGRRITPNWPARGRTVRAREGEALAGARSVSPLVSFQAHLETGSHPQKGSPSRQHRSLRKG